MLNLTPIFRRYVDWRKGHLRSADPVTVQESQLSWLVRKAAATKFGREHSFESIRTVSDYQKRVPLRTYEDFWREYWQPAFPRLIDCTWPGIIPYFPMSSGTTSGTTKYIPCSREMLRSNTKAGMDLLVHHCGARPESQILGGKSFMLGGSTDLNEEAPGIFSGDLSGISVVAMPWWARMRYFPPLKTALIKNWEEKIDRLAELSLKEDIRMLSGVPSWMLIFIDRLCQLRPEAHGKLRAIFPNLEMLVHGGVNFAPYIPQFRNMLEGSKAELREVYPASEGFIAIADRGTGEGLRMNIDNGIFYEFVPVDELGSGNPTRHWMGNIQPEINYAIVLTTCAGLWSYIIGDTVKFIETKPPRLLITGRTTYQLSAFGEHVIAEEVEDSVSRAASSCGLLLNDYCVGAVYPETPADLGGHLYVVEFSGSAIPEESTIRRFSDLIDEHLCKRNEDYAGHRADGFGLKAPEIRAVPQGTFAGWMKSRNKLGGQNKVPRIINKTELFNDLLSFCDNPR